MTVMSPEVKVPVLSKITVEMFPAFSRDSASLKRMPLAAPFPVPTVTAVGVARPKAQGQEIIRTEIAAVTA